MVENPTMLTVVATDFCAASGVTNSRYRDCLRILKKCAARMDELALNGI